jgi:hypothetical protein
MSEFFIRNSNSTLPQKWDSALVVPVTQSLLDDFFDSNGCKVSADHLGHKYKVIEKRTLPLPIMERVQRAVLGIFAVVFSVGLALISPSVRHLFTKQRTSIHIAELFAPDAPPPEEPKKIPEKEQPPEQPKADSPTKDDSPFYFELPPIKERSWVGDEHIQKYIMYLETQYPKLFVPPIVYTRNIEERATLKQRIIHDSCPEKVSGDTSTAKAKEKTLFPYGFNGSSGHWSLVLVDKEKRTVEHYDSLCAHALKKTLEDIAQTLSQKDPGETPYRFISATKKAVQSDGYQCGVWTVWFLEQRLENPDFDASSIDVNKMKTDILAFRNKVRDKINELSKVNNFHLVIAKDLPPGAISQRSPKKNAQPGDSTEQPLILEPETT